MSGNYGNASIDPHAEGLFLALTGEEFPQLDTDRARAAAQVLAAAGDRIDGQLTPLLQDRIDAAQTGMSGEMTRAFIAALEQYTTSPPYILPTTASLARQLGAYTASTADQAEEMKIQAIVALAVMIAALIVDAIIAYFSPEAGAEAAAAEIAATRTILQALLAGLRTAIMHAIPIAIAIQVGQDTLAQIIERSMGVEQNWNWAETFEQIGIGALGGVMGMVLKPVEERLTDDLAGLLGNLTGNGARDLGDDLGN